MYICVCNAVNESQVQQAIDRGQCSIQGIRKHLDFTSRCGKCNRHLRKMIDQHQQADPAQCKQCPLEKTSPLSRENTNA